MCGSSVWEQFVFYNSRIVEKMKTIDFILDGKFHLHTPKKEGFRTKSKVALKKKGALFGHSSQGPDRHPKQARGPSATSATPSTHTSHTTYTIVQRPRRRRGYSKKEKKKEDNHRKAASKLSLRALESEWNKRKEQQTKHKTEQEAHNQVIDEAYNKAVLERIRQEGLGSEYDKNFQPFFAMKEAREKAYEKLTDQSEEDKKRFNAYWRAKYAAKLREFLDNNHVGAPPQRKTYAEAYHAKIKEVKAKAVAEAAQAAATLVAAAAHVKSHASNASISGQSENGEQPGEEDPPRYGRTRESVMAARMSYDRALWDRS